MNSAKTIAQALTRVKQQTENSETHIVASENISRADRELLIATGWLQEIIRGWYMLVRPDVATGDTAAWYANFWDFVRVYLENRFATDYCLAAESSLDLLGENPLAPKQVIVIAKKGSGLQELLYDTSLLIYVDEKNFPKEITQVNGINVMSLPLALCKVAPSYFKANPREAELALRLVKVPGDLSSVISNNNLKTAAARIVGAYQFLTRHDMAETIRNDLLSVGILIHPINPFHSTAPLLSRNRVKSPYAARIIAMWAEVREQVIKTFPKPPGLPKDPLIYLHEVEEIYQYDAYNSLSIEGYRVSPELIAKVQDNKWRPEDALEDNNARNAMAARGYYEAFLQVKESIKQIFTGTPAGEVIENNLQTWYRHLFAPSVQAGIIKQQDLFGYRNDRVYIRNSRHAPPSKEAVVDAMESLFTCIQNEKHPAAKAILGHYFFVYIHPYMDGNGRMGRFLMNALLASGGYPWTVVRVSQRKQYISILEATHGQLDMQDFTQFIAGEMQVGGRET